MQVETNIRFYASQPNIKTELKTYWGQLLNKNYTYFFLEILIKKTNYADSGDIIVALVDDSESTLKRLRKKGQSIALESANPAYETRILAPHRVKVQGKLIGLLRKYQI